MTTLKTALQEAYRMELEEIPSERILNEDETLSFSPGFEKKMRRLIRRTDHPARYRIAQTAACLLLAALLGGGSVLTLVPEARAAFAGWMRDMYETWFVYRSIGEGQPISENTVFYPAWVPAGYEETVPPQAGTFVRAQYENGGGKLLTVAYLKGAETAYGSSALDVEWDGAVVRQTKVGGRSADLYLNPEDGPNILVWADEEKDAAFWITAPLTEAELVQIAESIQESEPMPRRYCVSWMPPGAYWVPWESEESGRSEIVYENSDENYSITFGYSADAAFAPHPGTKSYSAYVGNREGRIYPAAQDGGDKALIWTSQSGDTLWVRCPLPDEEMIQIAESVIVKLNRFSDLMDIPVFDDPNAPLDDLEHHLLPLVEQALTDSFVAQVEDCARRDAQTGHRASEEYERLQADQMAQCISPNREDAIARVTLLADALYQEGRRGENIISLFGPFYTASIAVSYNGACTHICDERGVMIASYNTYNNTEWVIVPTAEEMQFQYAVNQIYFEAYQAARKAMTEN